MVVIAQQPSVARHDLTAAHDQRVHHGPNGFVFDYWNHFSHLAASELGDSYFAVGLSGWVVIDG